MDKTTVNGTSFTPLLPPDIHSAVNRALRYVSHGFDDLGKQTFLLELTDIEEAIDIEREDYMDEKEDEYIRQFCSGDGDHDQAAMDLRLESIHNAAAAKYPYPDTSLATTYYLTAAASARRERDARIAKTRRKQILKRTAVGAAIGALLFYFTAAYFLSSQAGGF